MLLFYLFHVVEAFYGAFCHSNTFPLHLSMDIIYSILNA